MRTPESILLSVLAILSSPNLDSPANIEAAALLRENKTKFRRKVREYLESAGPAGGFGGE